VPVGDDQKQHVELCRDVAMRFNNLYGKVFTLPAPVMATEAGRVMDLQDPAKKMSKSEESGGTILLLDDASTIEKKIKRAVTDTIGKVAYDKANQPGVANLIEVYAACKSISIKDATAELSGSQYGALKAAVAEAVLAEVIPLQERFNALMGDRELLDDIFEAGAMRARRTANETLKNAYEAVGFVPAKGR
jgi:tryptophanyl-tRNA synthetase